MVDTSEDSSEYRSGGVDIEANEVTIAGDVVGRDKIVGYTADQILALLTQISATFQPKPFDGRCPYLGLDAFREEDADRFFGREKLVDELVARVKDSRAVFVTGPSGSGKSSLVRAGLIHALKQGTLPGSARWLYETLRPGRNPLDELARVASSLAATLNAGEDIRAKGATDATILHQWAEVALKDDRQRRAIVVVDQFEETFTQVAKERGQVRAAFIKLLTHAATVEGGRVAVLFVMRSDFVSECATYPELNAVLNQQFLQVGAMQPDELVSAIARPAMQVGLRIDPDLIAQVVNDMQDEPGALPLMQFTLKDLFDAQQAKGGVIALTLEDYLAHGGIRKSLERYADTAFVKLSEAERNVARSVFSGLITIGRGTKDTRRTATLTELVPAGGDPARVEAVVRMLADARLVTTDERDEGDVPTRTVTIAHETLIDAWPWLRRLVNENRDAIALQNQIAEDAEEWDGNNRDTSYLYTGARLATAREQLGARKIVLSGVAQAFVDASRTRQRRRQRVTIAGVVSFVGLLFLAMVVFGIQRDEAQRQARIALSRQLAAQATSNQDRQLDLALLLSSEAHRSDDTAEARSSLLGAVQANPRLAVFLQGHTAPVASVAFSPDGQTLASGSVDNTVILWDVSNPRSPVQMGTPLTGHSDPVWSVAFSPDGQTLASGSEDDTIILWDMSDPRSPVQLGTPLTGHTSSVQSVAFSPDGQTLASGSVDNTVILWDVSNPQSPVQLATPLTGHTSLVASVAFSPDGQTLASGSWDYTVILWDVSNPRSPVQMGLRPLTGHTSSVYSVAFSPDGETLASGGSDGTVILWDVSNPRSPVQLGTPLIGHSLFVNSVVFSPDGKTLASGNEDDTVTLWNVSNPQSPTQLGTPLTGHSDPVSSVAFGPDGQTLASGSRDGIVILWDVSNPQSPVQLGLRPLTGHTNSVSSVAFNPDGEALASGSDDTSVILWDVSNPRSPTQLSLRPLIGHSNWVYSVAFSPDGKTLASSSSDDTVILWDVSNPRSPVQMGLRPLTGHTSSVYSVAFSPDGKTLASGSWDGIVILWDVSNPRSPVQLGTPLTGHSLPVNSVAFSPDGKTLASGSSDNTIILWNVSNPQSPVQLGTPLTGHSLWVNSVAFSPDGQTLASGNEDGTVILWDVSDPRSPVQLGTPLTGHTSNVNSVAFSPDGETLASGSSDNTIILWDVSNPQSPTQLGTPLTGHTNSVSSVAFSPDGKTLASGSSDDTVILWDIRDQAWQDAACQRAGRNLTQAEWKRYLGEEPYHKTCDQWPAGK